MPQLQDPNFFHTTSLLSEFTSEGAMGVVLNRPLGITLGQIFKDTQTISSVSSLPAFWGGPVQNERGFVIHENESLASQSMILEQGLYLSGSSEVLRMLVEKSGLPNAPRFRLFLGYAGWGPGQLEREIAGSSWITAPLDKDLIFAKVVDTLWKKSIEKIGIDPIQLASVPQNQAH